MFIGTLILLALIPTIFIYGFMSVSKTAYDGAGVNDVYTEYDDDEDNV